MKKLTKLMLTLTLLIVGVGGVNATKLYADLSSSTATGNSTWDSSTKSFAWTAGSYAYMELKGLSGDLSEYTTLVVDAADYKSSWRIDVELTDGTVLKGSDRSMAYWSANKKEITLSEKYTAEQIAAVKAIRISTNSDGGSVTINAAYLEKPFSLVFDENGVATIDKTDLKGEGYISYDDETGIVTSHYGEDGAASNGSLKVNLPSEGIDISNCDGFKVNYTGTAVIGTIQFANATGGWSQQFGNNPLGRDGVASYLVNATSLNTMYWFGKEQAISETMTISSAELHGNVIKANDPHYTDLTKDMFTTSNCNLNLNVANTTIYGLVTPAADSYADVSDYDNIIMTGNANQKVRVFYNMVSEQTYKTFTFDASGNLSIDIANDFDNATSLHINAIKGENSWTDAFVTSLKLYKASVSSPYNYVLSGSGVLAPSVEAALADASATAIDATGITKATALTTANPNCLIVANEGMVTNAQNVIVDGTCANLVLTDGHPFKAPADFTATAAQYTTTINTAAQAGTLCLPFAATLPTDVKAYTLAYTSGDAATATEVETTIEANTPVLLNGSGEATFTGSGNVVASATNTNGALTGVFEAGYVPAKSYVLQKQGDNVGFYKVSADNTMTIKPFRAYLTATSEARSLRIIYADNTTTAITATAATPAGSSVVYDLQGRRVSQPLKGIYVKDGKKFIVK